MLAPLVISNAGKEKRRRKVIAMEFVTIGQMQARDMIFRRSQKPCYVPRRPQESDSTLNCLHLIISLPIFYPTASKSSV